MKKKLLFSAMLALSSLAASGESAAFGYAPTLSDTQWTDGTFFCYLEFAGTYNPVPVGAPFGFTVTASIVDFGPSLPPDPSIKPLQVVFHGTKNGVPDTGSGQYLMNAPINNPETGMTYNPGGMAGYYIRYAKLYYEGQHVCTTNSVWVELR